MDRASSLIFPGGKTLAGWWRQLAPREPLALWIGYVFAHRVEAAVQVVRAEPVDPLAHLVLQALALEPPGNGCPTRLQDRLHLPAAVLQRVLLDLHHDRLLTREADHWQATALGAKALANRTLPRQAVERRVFPFLERLDGAGQRQGTPAFVPLQECAGVPWTVNEPHRFDVAFLRSALEQPADWKESHGLRSDMQTMVNGADTESWQQVVVDRPERVLLAIVRTRGELLGFAVKVESWTLCDQTPALRLPTPEGLRHWTPEPDVATWQEAWRSWCRQRQLPATEVEACVVKPMPPRLEIYPPPRLLQRLQASKSDLFKGDAWLLVGDGYVRAAAQLAIGKTS